MSLQYYTQLQETLAAMPSEAVKAPTMPVDVQLQEAEDLSLWIQQDKRELKAAGLDWTRYVDTLGIRAGACRYAQALWIKERYEQKEIKKSWQDAAKEGFALRNALIADFKFVYPNNQRIAAALKQTRKGKSAADMIQDLSDLAVLGSEYVKTQNSIIAIQERIKKAQALSTQLGATKAKATNHQLSTSTSKLMRDKACSYLKEAVDEIRRTGKYVFNHIPDRKQGYISRYKKKS
ncbi:hypothetical protein ACE939_11830 [Aquimarina sp. W85]|uniref:hypothetical protein n=1 Tax=Aquimarina rhodophyticola TaxID=3342246 RepID=UPI00366E39DF